MLVSCYETDDKYEAGKEITVTGVESVYNKTALVDVLHIEPQIATTDPDCDLEYEWKLWQDYTGASSVPKDLVVDTISHERILDYLVVNKPQTYRVELKVTNNTTGQEAYAITTLNVTNDFSKGFYVMKDMGNAADMDLHTADGTAISNVIGKTQGAPMPGTPKSLGVYPKFSYDNKTTLKNEVTTTLNITTTEGFWVIDIADLSTACELETMFYFPGEPSTPLFGSFVYYGAIYVSDKGIHYSPYDLVWGAGGGTGIFGSAIAIEKGYRLNINIASDRYYTYFFDELNGRFLTVNYNGMLNACSDQDAGGNTPAVTPNNIDNKMLYFGRNKIGTTAVGFVVMQHPTDPTKRYLYEMTLNGLSTNPMLSKREITGLNLNEATLFANNELQSRVLYYATGSKVYRYLIDDQQENELTLTGFGTGEQITYLKNIYWTGASTDDGKFNYLAIGTQSGGNYKVYLYNLVAGVPTGSPVRVLTGEGKALKMHYITPEFTVDVGNYQYPIGF